MEEKNGKKNLLITGTPGIGKTTLVKKIADHIQNLHPVGFYSQEIREKGNRVGFELVGFDGRMQILAHVKVGGPYRVGKYGVDVQGFDEFLSGIKPEPLNQLVIMDEIGKMECYSSVFRNMVDTYFESERSCLATISSRGNAYIDGIKKRDDVKLHQVTRENRDELVGTIVSEILQLLR